MSATNDVTLHSLLTSTILTAVHTSTEASFTIATGNGVLTSFSETTTDVPIVPGTVYVSGGNQTLDTYAAGTYDVDNGNGTGTLTSSTGKIVTTINYLTGVITTVTTGTIANTKTLIVGFNYGNYKVGPVAENLSGHVAGNLLNLYVVDNTMPTKGNLAYLINVSVTTTQTSRIDALGNTGANYPS